MQPCAGKWTPRLVLRSDCFFTRPVLTTQRGTGSTHAVIAGIRAESRRNWWGLRAERLRGGLSDSSRIRRRHSG